MNAPPSLARSLTPSVEATRAALARAARDEADARTAVNAAQEPRTSRRPLPLLDRLFVATPCGVPWESMQGDARVRFCGKCEKHVYNVSAMTRDEAEGFLKAAESPCVRFYQRTDGTILTADCPVGAFRKVRRRWLGAMITAAVTAVGAASAALFGRGPAGLSSDSRSPHNDARSETFPLAVSGGSGFFPETPAPHTRTVAPTTKARKQP
jgi:hypothetical protein